MVKKAVKYICIVVLCIVSVTLCLAIVGEIAQAAGLVDDTVNASNLYSQYPLMNYQLDFYVDNSWNWLPWSWSNGVGQSVMYGLYCVTNFVWIINLYVSNAAGYVVKEAYELDFIDDMADKIGKNMQILAGVNESGFQLEGLYIGFLLLIILIIGVYVTYVGLIKRETSKAISSVMNFLLVFLLSAAFIANAPNFIKKINELSSDVSTATLSLGTKIMMSDTESGGNSVELIRDCLFSIQIKQPWLLLQYGDTNEGTVGKDRVTKLLSVSPSLNSGKDRENVVKTEIENKKNSNLTTSGVITRLGMVFFISIFNLFISFFVFVLCGYMLLSQVMFIIFALMLVFGLIIAMIPGYNGNLKKSVENLFNTILMRAGITLIVTITFSISSMFYSMSTEYPFFMVMFLQIVLFCGVFYNLNRILGMIGLNSSDAQQVGRRVARKPLMMLHRSTRRMGRQLSRSFERSMNNRSHSTKADGQQEQRQNNMENQNMQSRSNPNQESNIKYRNNTSSITNMQNKYENEKEHASETSDKMKPGTHTAENRSNVKNMGERLGNKVGAALDTKDKVADKAKDAREKVKDLSVNSSHKALETRTRLRDNVVGFKKGVTEERLNRQAERENQRETYRHNVSVKREELKQEKETRRNRHSDKNTERPGLDSVTFAQKKERSEKHSDRGHDR